MNYVQFNQSISSSEDEQLICRICLENDEIDNLIYPCRCAGNSKYVHRKCLNEWRTINRDNDNYKQCDICKFEYIIINNNQHISL